MASRIEEGYYFDCWGSDCAEGETTAGEKQTAASCLAIHQRAKEEHAKPNFVWELPTTVLGMRMPPAGLQVCWAVSVGPAAMLVPELAPAGRVVEL